MINCSKEPSDWLQFTLDSSFRNAEGKSVYVLNILMLKRRKPPQFARLELIENKHRYEHIMITYLL